MRRYAEHTDGIRAVVTNHGSLRAQIDSLAVASAVNYEYPLVTTLAPRNIGLILGALMPLSAGCLSIFIPALTRQRQLASWLYAASKLNAGVILTTPAVLESALHLPTRDRKMVSLASTRQILVAGRRATPDIITAFTRSYTKQGLADNAVSPLLATAEGLALTLRPHGVPAQTMKIRYARWL